MAGYIGKGKAQSLTDVPDVINHDVAMTGNLDFGDDKRLRLGASQDLQIYHDGSNSYITDVGTGDLVITSNGNKVGFASTASGFEWMVEANCNGAVNLLYDGSTKVQTASYGANVAGNIRSNLHSFEGDADSGMQYVADGDFRFIRNGSEIIRCGTNDNIEIKKILTPFEQVRISNSKTGGWSNRTMLVEHNDGSGYSQPAIGFHAPQNYSAGILKFWGASGEFEFRNELDNNFKAVRALAFTVSSDYRLKENIVPLEGAIDRIKQLPVHRFNFIDNPDVTVDGYLAHELAEVVPEAVTGEKDGMYTPEDGGESTPIYQGVDQAKVTPLLVAALQEAIARIETLEAEVATLKGAV